MSLECVLWDFGDTLVDEGWMLEAPPGVPRWRAAWVAIARGELADDWNLGRVAGAEIDARVAARLGIGADAVAAHVRACCTRIRFFATPVEVARRLRGYLYEGEARFRADLTARLRDLAASCGTDRR